MVQPAQTAPETSESTAPNAGMSSQPAAPQMPSAPAAPSTPPASTTETPPASIPATPPVPPTPPTPPTSSTPPASAPMPEQSMPTEMPKKSGGSKFLLIFLFILIIVALAFGAYYYLVMMKPAPVEKIKVVPTPKVTVAPTEVASAAADMTNWKTYTSTASGYSIQYPPDWTLDATYKDPQGNLSGTPIAITDPQGDKLVFDFGFRPLGVPPHVYKTANVIIDGTQIVKTYNDGCDFTATGQTAATATCKGKETQFYAITYSTPAGVSSDPSVVDSKAGSNDYQWLTGTRSVALGMTGFHGKPAYLALILAKRLSLTDISFQPTDTILDRIIGTLKFTK